MKEDPKVVATGRYWRLVKFDDSIERDNRPYLYHCHTFDGILLRLLLAFLTVMSSCPMHT